MFKTSIFVIQYSKLLKILSLYSSVFKNNINTQFVILTEQESHLKPNLDQQMLTVEIT